MLEETQEFFHKVLEKVVPSLTHEGREKVILGVISDCFDHPWSDDEMRSSIASNLARQYGLVDELPEDLRDEDLQDEDEDEDEDDE